MYTSKDIIKCRLKDYIVSAIVEYEILRVQDKYREEEKIKLENKWNLKFKNLKEFDNIVDELFDKDSVVHGLSEKNTKVLRFKMGIYNDVEELSFAEVSKEIGISSAYCRALFKKSIRTLTNRVMSFIENDNMMDDNILNKSLYYLDLPAELYNPLHAVNIKTIGDLISMDKESLMKISDIGRKLIDEIENKVHLAGLKLYDENSDACNTELKAEPNKRIISQSMPKIKSEDKSKLEKEELRKQIKNQDKYIHELEKKLNDYTELLREARDVVENLEKSIKNEKERIEELYNQNSNNERLAINIRDNIDKILSL